MARAQGTDAKPVTLPPSISSIRRNLYSLNLGYLLLMKSVAETDMSLAIHTFKVQKGVIEKVSLAPYQVLADLARVLTITPVLRSDMPDSAWSMIGGVISGEVSLEDLGAYVLSMSGK